MRDEIIGNQRELKIRKDYIWVSWLRLIMNIRSQPLGISGYELSKLIPEEFRGSMPTIEEIEAELNE